MNHFLKTVILIVGYSLRKLTQYKHSVSEKFQYMVYKALCYSLEGIVFKGPENNQKKFYTNFLAQALFIIPEFNERFIKIIQTIAPSDFWPKYFELITAEQEKLGGLLFNWNEYFYKFLLINNQTTLNKSILQTSLCQENQCMWATIIKQKKGIFLEIITSYMKYCHYYVKSSFYPWTIIPGYLTIVKEAISVMRERTLLQYTDTFLETCNSLLLNESLLNIMIYTIFSQTKYS